MRRFVLPVLVVLLLLPVITLFIFDVRYNHLQKSVCSAPDKQHICDYPELNERERIITTSFYRHLGDYFGRQVGTSPSFLDVESNTDSELKERIGDFNRSFAVAMLFSIILATISGTLLTQRIIASHGQKHHKYPKT